MAKPQPSKWYLTGDARVAPWWFGLMRAEVMERRDFFFEDGEEKSYETRWVGAGRLPAEFGDYNLWSTLASPVAEHPGSPGFWRRFITLVGQPRKRAA